MKENIFIVFMICFLIGMVFLIGKLWNAGTKYHHYKSICIKGHEYHVANFMTKIATSIKLTDDGKPIPCKGD